MFCISFYIEKKITGLPKNSVSTQYIEIFHVELMPQ